MFLNFYFFFKIYILFELKYMNQQATLRTKIKFKHSIDPVIFVKVDCSL